jgi:hypothetical protein
MTRGIVRHLGWVFLVLDAILIITGLVIFTQTAGSNLNNGILGTYSLVIAFSTFPAIGALIISRKPGNTIGWIFCAIGLGTAFTSFSAAFVQQALATHTDDSAIVGLVDMLGNTIWPLNLGMGTLLLFLFPTGRLLSPRWRFVFWADVALIAVASLTSLVMPGYLETTRGHSGPPDRVWNPLGIVSAKPLIEMINQVGGSLFVLCALASFICIIIRYVTSRDIQRQQIKWFALGAAAMVAIIVPSFFFIPGQDTLSNILFALGIVMLPIGAGIGILRYRLFDIDVIINRTLVYGSLTAVLAAIYFAGVIGVQALVNLLSGRALSGQQEQQSPVLIVVTTLLVAALFQPLRRRFQQFIDHRFYRSRYDAKKTLDRFGASLRSQIELDHLTDHLLDTVNQTMHPAHVTLWLRVPESERPS